jgi:hypothetical protein
MRFGNVMRRFVSARTQSRVRGLAYVGVACLLYASGCRSHQTPPPSGDVVDLNSNGQRSGRTTVRVDNRTLADMTIYAYQSTHRIRLGRAAGNTVTNIVIPGSIISGVTELRFYAEPMGNARGAISEPIPVSPGDQVDFTIP